MSHTLLVFIFNAVGVVAVVLYLVSIRYIGVPWARLQWKMWRRAQQGDRYAYRVSQYIVFPGSTMLTDNFGDRIRTRWTRSPRTWFAPMAAIAVSRFNEADPAARPAFFLQVQALFWPLSVAWSIIWFPCSFSLMILGKIVITLVRTLTRTKERDLAALCLVPRVPHNPTT